MSLDAAEVVPPLGRLVETAVRLARRNPIPV
jgi:hypothetical protein